MVLNRFIHIIKKEWTLEFREKYGFLSSLLYLIAVCFVIFKVFGKLEGPTRMGLFWLIFLFTAINIVSASFNVQTIRRKLYYYQLYDPVELLIAKIAFNYLKLFLAGCLLVALMILFGGESLKGPGLFLQSFAIVAFGICILLCVVSAISSFSDKQASLVSILSLPMMIPLLLLGMRLSLISERFFSDSATGTYVLMLIGIDLLLMSLAVLFIPLIWKS